MAGSPQAFTRAYPATADEVFSALRAVIEDAQHKGPKFDSLTRSATWFERRPAAWAYPHNWSAQVTEDEFAAHLRLTGSLKRTMFGGDPWAQPAAERVYAAVSAKITASRAA